MYNKNINRWKLKKWYDVELPDYMGSKVIGQIISHDPSNLLNRKIKFPLSDITQNTTPKALYSNIIFKTTEVKGNKIIVKPVGFEIALSYLKSLAKKRKNVIHSVLDIKLKDETVIRLKLLLITFDKISRTVEKNLRKEFENQVRKVYSKMTFQEFIIDLINDNSIKSIFQEVNKINPIEHCLIKKYEIRS